MSRSYHVAIFGALGGVGGALLELLEERGFPVESLRLFDLPAHEKETIAWNGKTIDVETIDSTDLQGIQLAFLCTPAAAARQVAPILAKQKALVFDLSGSHRDRPDVPLLLAERNPDRLYDALHANGSRIVALPGPVAGPLVAVLSPLHALASVEEVVFSTYQSVSFAGHEALEELHKQTASVLNVRDFTPRLFPEQIAFQLWPQDPPKEVMDADGFSSEERACVAEIRRLLGNPAPKVLPTCVYVPCFVGCGVSLAVRTSKEPSASQIRECLRAAPSLYWTDGDEEEPLPTLAAATRQDAIFVGRLRVASPGRFSLWLSYDNQRKGGALQALQLAEIAIRDHEGAIP
jgi:aspartate-semialdehyde dehydrogenase